MSNYETWLQREGAPSKLSGHIALLFEAITDVIEFDVAMFQFPLCAPTL